MNEVKLNINIPYSMFKQMFYDYFDNTIGYHTPPKLVMFTKAYWVLFDRELRDRMIESVTHKDDVNKKLGDSDSELSNFKEWMIAHRDANEQGSLLNVINLPAEMQYKDKLRGG